MPKNFATGFECECSLTETQSQARYRDLCIFLRSGLAIVSLDHHLRDE